MGSCFERRACILPACAVPAGTSTTILRIALPLFFMRFCMKESAFCFMQSHQLCVHTNELECYKKEGSLCGLMSSRRRRGDQCHQRRINAEGGWGKLKWADHDRYLMSPAPAKRKLKTSCARVFACTCTRSDHEQSNSSASSESSLKKKKCSCAQLCKRLQLSSSFVQMQDA